MPSGAQTEDDLVGEDQRQVVRVCAPVRDRETRHVRTSGPLRPSADSLKPESLIAAREDGLLGPTYVPKSSRTNTSWTAKTNRSRPPRRAVASVPNPVNAAHKSIMQPGPRTRAPRRRGPWRRAGGPEQAGSTRRRSTKNPPETSTASHAETESPAGAAPPAESSGRQRHVPTPTRWCRGACS